MIGMADIHCHLLPYVDDGAADLEESLQLLKMEAEQGVRTICLTPHLRYHMFDTPDEEIKRRFLQLTDAAENEGIPIELHLSREYHCDEQFLRKLHEHTLIPYGASQAILLEFSAAHAFPWIVSRVEEVLEEGYAPLIAHVERYPAVREKDENIEKLRALGAAIQVNAGSLLGREGLKLMFYTRRLLKDGAIYCVSSDAHSLDGRPPELSACSLLIQRLTDTRTASKLLKKNPRFLLKDLSEE